MVKCDSCGVIFENFHAFAEHLIMEHPDHPLNVWAKKHKADMEKNGWKA